MQHKYEICNTQMRYYMPQEIDQHIAKDIREFLEQKIMSEQIRELIFDFSETEFMDSSGIGIVIGRCRTLGYYNGKVYVQNIGERIDKIFLAAGLYQMVEVKEELS